MNTEISPKNWKPFYQILNESRGMVISLRWTESNGVVREVFEDAPLHKVTWEKNECNDILTIEAGPLDNRPAQHQIVEPIRMIATKSTDGGRYKHLEILAETGKTEITFSPGMDSDQLEHLAA